MRPPTSPQSPWTWMEQETGEGAQRPLQAEENKTKARSGPPSVWKGNKRAQRSEDSPSRRKFFHSSPGLPLYFKSGISYESHPSFLQLSFPHLFLEFSPILLASFLTTQFTLPCFLSPFSSIQQMLSKILLYQVKSHGVKKEYAKSPLSVKSVY